MELNLDIVNYGYFNYLKREKKRKNKNRPHQPNIINILSIWWRIMCSYSPNNQSTTPNIIKNVLSIICLINYKTYTKFD